MREFKIRLGKFLIVLSFIILILGASFNLDASNKTVEILNNDNFSNVIIPSTTIDGHNNTNNGNFETNDNNISTVDNSGNKDSKSDNSVSNGNTYEITDSSTVDNEINNKSNNSSVNSNTNFSSEVNNLRDSIENKYNIKISLGLETSKYMVGGYTVTSITDESTAKSVLSELDKNLALYPSGMLDEISNAGLPLTVYLIQRYSASNVTGITEKVRSGVNISIAADFSFADSFNHEMYHYIEHYIYAKGGSYTNWNNYNPTGFTYGNYDDKYVYDATFSEDAFFVNSYAQSYEYEDRASTFEYMMAPSKISPLNHGKNIWLKGKVICETIDYYFSTVNSDTTEYWERFIY